MFVEIDFRDADPLISSATPSHKGSHWIVNISNVSHVERTEMWERRDSFGKVTRSTDEIPPSMEVTITKLWGIQIHGANGRVIRTYYSDIKEKMDYLIVKLLEAISVYHCTSTINFDDYENFCATNAHINAGAVDPS
jgi:hypothetical protein